MNEEDIFARAIEISSPQERVDLVRSMCGEDSALMRNVMQLLEAHDEQDFLLDSPAVLPETSDIPITDKTIAQGLMIGDYKLLQEIGEGGFGVVYMAEQADPSRRVALKVIKPGMDSKVVIARFEAERQALAMMEHPNIARIFGGGTTDTGRPYFVMELVKGVPITEYCDDKRLSPRERLELVIPICRAVQHAHQKGIIHRDLKPSNVLVAEFDDVAVPKIIDFGVAKALNQRLTEKTMFTEYGQVVGTLQYMSPEQAKFNQLDIDTRSDIYSLGVILYELLTGTTPLDRKRLQTAGLEEMMRIIREEEPQKPSTKIDTSEDLPAVAKHRHTEPKRLSTIVRGDLDWIVMKSLEKDRNRRYGTAQDFAGDIQRFLEDEPVSASPPSLIYRARKFAIRNRAAVISGSLVAMILLMTLGLGLQYQLSRAQRRIDQFDRERAEEIAKAERELRVQEDRL